MKPKSLFAGLCVIGAVLPYTQFVPFVMEHGLNLRILMQDLFATRASSFFALDVLVSSLVLVAFIRVDGRRVAIKHRWVPIVALLTVGVSLALPLYLYLRERHLEGLGAATTT
jgi:hypothetical protein